MSTIHEQVFSAPQQGPDQTSTSKLGQILVVDDELELKNVLVELLCANGFDVAGFTSAHAALDALRGQNFDVLLSDLMMPAMDGITLLSAALEVDEHLECIIMTGQGTIQTAVDAMKLGAFDYVLKPFSLQSLLPVLNRAINMRRLRQENLQLRESVAIHELCQTITFTLEPAAILSKLADTALQQSKADEVAILLPTEDGTELYVAEVRGRNRERLIGKRVKFDRSVSSWIGRELRPQLLDSEIEDARFTPCNPRSDIRSAISVPLQIAGKLIGIINIGTVTGARPFTTGQMKALTILASTAAAALENAALHTQVLQAEENYRSIFDNAVEGIFQSTLEGRFKKVNQSLARILGYDSPDELMDSIKDIASQLHVDTNSQAEAAMLLEDRGVLQGFEFEAFRKDGSKIWLCENKRSVRDSNNVELYREGTLEDITERKRAEEALRQSEEQLRQSQKLEAVGQLAGGIAHDFNNLLTIISGYSDLALRNLDKDNPIRTNIEEIRRAGQRAATLTRQLLAFSRKQVLQPKVLRLNRIVADVEKMLRRLIGEDIDLLTLLEPSLGQIKADPGQIEQVIVNLVVNARDAMPQGGKLTVETANVYLDNNYARKHVAILPGHYVMLAVSDTGCGMSPETSARAFEPFFTTKDAGKGTGLGLSTVYGIVKQSGGNVWAYSEEGRGSTFKIYLPRVDEVVSGELDRDFPNELPQGRETILLAEDEDQVRRMTRKILEMNGYRVIEAGNGEEALLVYEEHKGRFDLVLTDAVMPLMSGRELAESLKFLDPNVKLLFMSGYTDDAIVRHGLLDDELAFLQKPFTPDALMRKVREVLDTKKIE